MSKGKWLILAVAIIVICGITGCAKIDKGVSTMMSDDIFSIPGRRLISPTGNYEATIEEFDNNGVKSYALHIVEVNCGKSTEYETDLIFRARDKNFVFWADNEDVLWAYSGDIGTFFWTKEDGIWVKRAYADNKDAIVPQALIDARPHRYQ